MKLPSWIKRPQAATLGVLAALALASGSGFLAAQALGIGTQAPTKTTTINAGEGATGPTGPSGPAGPPGPKGDPGQAGAESCPSGSDFEAVVFNHPGGHITIWTCVAQ